MKHKRHFDNLIVGAGLSGISAAYYLSKRCRERSFAILERRENIGGTWDLFKYPGIRSDSDMHTLGFAFKPWTAEKAIADGPDIMHYLQETVDECGLRPSINFGRKLLSANYDSSNARWMLSVVVEQTQKKEIWSCNFLHLCSGYYDYDQGHAPRFEGQDNFDGEFVHPQFWPSDLNYEGKRVVVIGSGATAVTLVPAIAEKARHVVMLQRSPTYVVAQPARDKFANSLRRFLPASWAYGMVRWKNILMNTLTFNWARKYPESTKKYILNELEKHLPEEYVRTHFSPSYNPWDQRICVVPDADMFRAISQDTASVVTDHIKRITASGIELQSGDCIDADIIVSATGLKLNSFGNAELSVDGEKLNSGELLTYKGSMFANVPNLAVTFGYTNSSWTLKADLTSEYVAKLMKYMYIRDYAECVPVLAGEDVVEEDALEFTSGYVLRAQSILPKQGHRKPWRVAQNYFVDRFQLRRGKINDGVLRFRKHGEIPSCHRANRTAAE